MLVDDDGVGSEPGSRPSTFGLNVQGLDGLIVHNLFRDPRLLRDRTDRRARARVKDAVPLQGGDKLSVRGSELRGEPVHGTISITGELRKRVGAQFLSVRSEPYLPTLPPPNAGPSTVKSVAKTRSLRKSASMPPAESQSAAGMHAMQKSRHRSLVRSFVSEGPGISQSRHPPPPRASKGPASMARAKGTWSRTPAVAVSFEESSESRPVTTTRRADTPSRRASLASGGDCPTATPLSRRSSAAGLTPVGARPARPKTPKTPTWDAPQGGEGDLGDEAQQADPGPVRQTVALSEFTNLGYRTCSVHPSM